MLCTVGRYFVLNFRIPTVFDIIPLELVRFRNSRYSVSSCSFSCPACPLSLSLSYFKCKSRKQLRIFSTEFDRFHPYLLLHACYTFYSSSVVVPLHCRSIASWVYHRSPCRLAARSEISHTTQAMQHIDLRSACPDYIFAHSSLDAADKSFWVVWLRSMANLGLGTAALLARYKPKCYVFFCYFVVSFCLYP